MAAKTFQAKIELGGQLQASLGGAVRAAQNQLNRLGNAARAITARIGAAFSKVGSFLKSFAGQLIGVTLAFAGLRSAGEFISKSKEQFEANTAAAARLGAAIRNNTSITKQGAKVTAEQEKRVAAWADQMQEISPYATAIWKEGAVSLLQYGATAKEIEKVGTAMNNVLASKKGVKATAEDAKALATAIGKAVASGKTGKLGKDLIVSKDEEKRFAKMRTSAERLDFLIGKINKKYGGQAKALVGTPAYEIAQAENKIADVQARMGEGFTKVEAKWKGFVARMLPHLEPVMAELTTRFGEGFDVVAGYIETKMVPALEQMGQDLQQVALDPEVQQSWKDLNQAAKDLQDAFKPFADAFKELVGLDTSKTFKDIVKQEVLDFFKALAATLKTITEALKFIQKWSGWGELQKTQEFLGKAAIGEKAGELGKQLGFQQWKGEKPAAPIAAGLETAGKAPGFFEKLGIGKKVGELGRRVREPAPLPVTPGAEVAFKRGVPVEVPKVPQVEVPQIEAPAVPDFTVIEAEWDKVKDLEFSEITVPTPDFSEVKTETANVETAANQAGSAFAAWDVPAALKSGLSWVVGKAKEAAAAVAGAGSGPVKGMGPPATAMQEGGIVSRPTFGMMGEAGPEAVIPLNRSAGAFDLIKKAASAIGIMPGEFQTPGYLSGFADMPKGGLIGQLMGAMGRGKGSTSVNYNPSFAINGGGPELAHQVESIVRRAHDELLERIEAADHEQMRRAFI